MFSMVHMNHSLTAASGTPSVWSWQSQIGNPYEQICFVTNITSHDSSVMRTNATLKHSQNLQATTELTKMFDFWHNSANAPFS